MRQDEIDRAIILIYQSRNAHGFVNYSQPVDALDKLPMEGLEELMNVYRNRIAQIELEIKDREFEGMNRFSRRYYEGEINVR